MVPTLRLIVYKNVQSSKATKAELRNGYFLLLNLYKKLIEHSPFVQFSIL